MHEASKSRKLWGALEHGVLKGSGIDIGCGKDPVTAAVRPFEREHGDANVISRHVKEEFDFVFSAHCLEHMHEPKAALHEWWKLVKPGGHLFFIVPDEDLYEQGVWPPVFNPDHKATFTLSKRTSWSKCSYNVLDLVRSLPESELVDLRLQDDHYDRSYLKFRSAPWWWTKLWAALRMRMILLSMRVGCRLELNWISTVFRVPIDQTANKASAQIQAIVRKRGGTGSDSPVAA